jgi:hypothetical protein
MQLLPERSEAFAQMMERLRSLQEEARYPARPPSEPEEWGREREALRRERDRLGALLLESEQKVAELSEQWSTEQNVDLEVAELRLVLAQLEHEYSKVFRSTSWRLTKPVRLLGRLRSRRS